jgi:hypothetical protein
MIAFEIVFILILVIIQLFVFIAVWRKIIQFKNFFPSSFNSVKIEKFRICKRIINDNDAFSSFIENIGKNDEVVFIEGDEIEETELLVINATIKEENPEFHEVIKSTNAYLCKNKGASADFNILQDTCERHLQKLDNGIGNLINVPLYIGLAGTFLGVIVGLWGIDFSNASNGVSISTDSIGQLLNGVIAAMIASLVGLTFTVWNTALHYKPAAYQNDTDKNNYYDFLQRELLPVLNVGMAGSLTNFKSVLNHFIIRFGENIENYSDSAELLNENLAKQQFVLEEINKLGITRTAQLINEAFVNLKDSSEDLATFKEYQKSLNENITKTDSLVQNINTTINQFKDFNNNLKVISNNTVTSIELQKQFKESLEKHFPVISDHREVWRKQVDELNLDIKEVYKQLDDYFKKSTEYIQTFISNNQNFFTGVNDIQNSIKVFVENSSIQNEYFKELKTEITEMRNDYRDSQKATLEMNKELIEVIKNFNLKLTKIEVVYDGKSKNDKVFEITNPIIIKENNGKEN